MRVARERPARVELEREVCTALHEVLDALQLNPPGLDSSGLWSKAGEPFGDHIRVDEFVHTESALQ